MTKQLGAGLAAAVCALSALATAAPVPKGYIEAPVRAANGELSACWNAALARNDKLRAARVVMSYRIETDGSVSHAVAKENSSRDAELAACITRVFVDLRYPAGQPEPIKVTFPVELSRND